MRLQNKIQYSSIRVFFFLGVFLTGGISACVLEPEASFTRIPRTPWPREYEGSGSWFYRVEILEATGHSRCWSFTEKEAIQLPLAETGEAVLLCTPIRVSDGVAAASQGCFWPWETEFSWRSGALARAFFRLAEQGVPPYHYNLPVLLEKDKTAKGNPWFRDWDFIEDKLARGQFRWYYLRERDLLEVDPCIPEDVQQGLWLNPLLPPWRRGDKKKTLLPEGPYTLLVEEKVLTLQIRELHSHP